MGHAERRNESRRRLVETAARLFSERGVEETSIDDVAAAAGLAKGTFYYNFAGKDELVLAVAAFGVTPELEKLGARFLEADPVTVLEEILETVARYAEREPRIAEVAYRTALNRNLAAPPKPASDRPSLRKLLGRVIERAQATGAIRGDLPAEVLGNHLGLLYTGEAFDWLATRRAPTLRKRTGRVLQLFLEGARPR